MARDAVASPDGAGVFVVDANGRVTASVIPGRQLAAPAVPGAVDGYDVAGGGIITASIESMAVTRTLPATTIESVGSRVRSIRAFS